MLLEGFCQLKIPMTSSGIEQRPFDYIVNVLSTICAKYICMYLSVNLENAVRGDD